MDGFGLEDAWRRRARGFVRAVAVPVLVLQIGSAVAVEVPADRASLDEAPRVVTPRGSRPRIGLVLGGGGAKGAAHVGVLTLLEDMRIPIDCVVGTSMGALVGGTYASGMRAHEVETAIRDISWSQTIAFEGRREKLPMRRKLAGATYSNNIEFSYRDGGVAVPRGFINTQNIEQTISTLVSRSLGVNDFDQMPIPFRAISTDMRSGEMLVMKQGDLAQAMRASMSLPGVFAPVLVDGRVLGDGSLTRNLPVDIARQTCADVVIAVSVPTPPLAQDDALSPFTLISRSLDVMIGASDKLQLDTLGANDVKIVVPMGRIGSSSFEKVAEAIPLGRRAAEEHRDELRRYSLPAAEYQAWLDQTVRQDRAKVTLAAVEIQGIKRVDEAYVRANLGLQAGSIVDQVDLGQAMNRLFDLDDFDSVQYALTGDPHNPNLQVNVAEKAAGPNILRFDLGLSMGTDSGNAFIIGADYLRPWINSRGGEVHGQLQFGRTSLAQLSLYQPLDTGHLWFVEPGLRLSRSIEDIYIDGDAALRFTFTSAYGFFDAGRTFGQSTELRVGLRSGTQSAHRDIVTPDFPEVDAEGYGGYTIGLTYDDRNETAMSTRGWLGRLRYYHGVTALGSESVYERAEAMLARSLEFRGDVVIMRVAGGSSSGGELPFYDYFTLGGPLSFPGLHIGQLRGTSYWSGTASYLHKIADLSALFGQSLYAGMQFTAGDMAGRIDEIDSAPLYSAAIIVGGRTPLGPLTLSLAATSDSDWTLLFGLGRPIEERNISDPVW